MGKCYNFQVCGQEDRRNNKNYLCAGCNRKINDYIAKVYLNKGLLNQDEKIHPELIVDEARKIAVYLSWTEKMTNTGLRKFYAKMKAIEGLYRASRDWQETQNKLLTLIQNAEYGAKRETVPAIWVTIIEKNIKEATQSPKHFEAMLNHMQGIVAFFKENREGRR